MYIFTRFFVFFVALSCVFQASAQLPTPLQVQLQTFATGLSSPVGIYNCGDDRLFILEQSSGDIEMLNASGQSIGKFLDLTGLISTGGERGLLGLAFHPNYLENGFFFVNYTNTAGNTVIARYTVSGNPNIANSGSAQIIMTINQPYGNHNGGHIEFGPDGYLYIGMGDGGSTGDPQNYAQTNSTLLGKMLRIDVDNGLPYTIPADNPYFTSLAVPDEIWAFGLRNPWKFSFDRQTGDMWMGDVGLNAWEEVNFQPANSPGGENYGWRCYEGNAPYNTNGCQPQANYEAPVAVISHGNPYSWCSITGGVVYRGNAYPGMQGHYLFTDYCAGNIFAIKHEDDNFNMHQALSAQGFGFVAFGQNTAGEVFLAKVNNGTIYRVVDTCGDFMASLSEADGTLSASAGSTHWWYRNGLLIAGASGATYTPTESGAYTVVVSNGSGCSRESNAIDFEFIVVIQGCTNLDACNYNPDAEEENGTCAFIGDACDDNDLTTTNTIWEEGCECLGEPAVIYGCTNSEACNYYPIATDEDGSCGFVGDACDDGDATTENDVYNVNCTCEGTLIIIEGCMDPAACNYNALANTDDGACTYVPLYEIMTGGEATQQETINYTYTNTAGSVYTWDVMSGTILAGQGTSSIVVLWDADGSMGAVSVFETTQDLCIGESVMIEFLITPIAVNEQQFQHFQFYPNPAAETITIDPGNYNGMMRIEILDLQGRIVHAEVARGSTTVPLAHLAAGTYVLRGTSNGTQRTKVLMISR
jgi:glucose/arabinose dehydrogenase